MAGLVCDIVTPAAKLYSDDAYMVVVPGVEGEMGFLKGHVPLVSVLADGVARIQNEKDGETQRFALQGGYVEVTGKKVIILADRALPAGRDRRRAGARAAGGARGEGRRAVRGSRCEDDARCRHRLVPRAAACRRSRLTV